MHDDDSRYLSELQKNERSYAAGFYFRTRNGNREEEKFQNELMIAEIIQESEHKDSNIYSGEFSKPDQDPPDVLLIQAGKRIGIEITEIVSEEAIRHNTHVKKEGNFYQDLEKLSSTKDYEEYLSHRKVPVYATYTITHLYKIISQSIAKKDEKLKSTDNKNYDELRLLFFSAEPEIDSRLVTKMLEQYKFCSTIFMHIHLLLGDECIGEPGVDETHNPIFRLA